MPLALPPPALLPAPGRLARLFLPQGHHHQQGVVRLVEAEAGLEAVEPLAELEAAGYRLVETHAFLPRQYFLVFERKTP